MSQSPRKIRIVQPGWESYSGPYGHIEFKDGVSVDPVDWLQADRIAADLQVVDAADGEQIGAQVRLIETKCIPLDALDRLMTAEDEPPPAPVPVAPAPSAPEKVWSVEALHDIADKEGIKGLREIGNALGAKGRAIPELIEDILKVQDEKLRAANARLPREG